MTRRQAQQCEQAVARHTLARDREIRALSCFSGFVAKVRSPQPEPPLALRRASFPAHTHRGAATSIV